LALEAHKYAFFLEYWYIPAAAVALYLIGAVVYVYMTVWRRYK